MKELRGAVALEQAAGMPSSSTSEQPKADPTPSKTAPLIGAEESFQETIKKTMERMQASGEQATAAAAADDSDDILAELMKQMQAGAGLEGEGSEEDFSKMLLGMMEQLTNKEILYEPMKELDEKFPGWIDKNKAQTPAEDMKRYEEQQRVVREIVAKFEEKTYADSNVADREYIVDRMQKVRHYPFHLWPVLTYPRCKQLVHHHRTLLGIWQQLKRRLERLKKAVHSNRVLPC